MGGFAPKGKGKGGKGKGKGKGGKGKGGKGKGGKGKKGVGKAHNRRNKEVEEDEEIDEDDGVFDDAAQKKYGGTIDKIFDRLKKSAGAGSDEEGPGAGSGVINDDSDGESGIDLV